MIVRFVATSKKTPTGGKKGWWRKIIRKDEYFVYATMKDKGKMQNIYTHTKKEDCEWNSIRTLWAPIETCRQFMFYTTYTFSMRELIIIWFEINSVRLAEPPGCNKRVQRKMSLKKPQTIYFIYIASHNPLAYICDHVQTFCVGRTHLITKTTTINTRTRGKELQG